MFNNYLLNEDIIIQITGLTERPRTRRYDTSPGGFPGRVTLLIKHSVGLR